MVTVGRNDTGSAGRRRFGLALTIAAGLGAAIWMYWITAHDIGVSPDSTIYIEAAKSWTLGNGLYVQGKPMTHYPPAYPMFLGATSLLFEGDLLQAARFVAIFFFGTGIFLSSLGVKISTNHSLLATAVSIYFLLSSTLVIQVYWMAWSEAPFTSFSMLSLLLLACHILRPNRWILVLASLAAGLAILTRYVGIVLLPAMILAFLLFDDRCLGKKAIDITLVGSSLIFPLMMWLYRNISASQTAINRELAFHPFNLRHIRSIVGTFYQFSLSIPVIISFEFAWIGSIAVIFISGTVLLLGRGYIRRNIKSAYILIPSIYILYSIVYIIFITISISVLDAQTPVDYRILLPVLLPLASSYLALVWAVSEQLQRKYIWYAFIAMMFFSASINAAHAVPAAWDMRKNGSGYTSRHWQQSEIIGYLTEIQDERMIYSNGPDAIRFLTDKDAWMIPGKTNPYTTRLHKSYDAEIEQIFEDCREGRVLIAYLDDITWRWYLPLASEIESVGDLPVLSRLQDGVVYGTR